MHIADGLVPAQICIGGYGITGLTTWYSLSQINRKPDPTAGIPKASLLAAAFFALSSIHIPIPPTTVHLVLNGVLGVVLGIYAFPAILIGLLFQALVFGHGGLSTLGINAVILGVPALIAAQIFRLRNLCQTWPRKGLINGCFAFGAGSLAVAMSMAIFFSLIITTIPSGFDRATEQIALYGLILAHVPLILIEGIFTATLVLFLQRVKPGILRHEG